MGQTNQTMTLPLKTRELLHRGNQSGERLPKAATLPHSRPGACWVVITSLLLPGSRGVGGRFGEAAPHTNPHSQELHQAETQVAPPLPHPQMLDVTSRFLQLATHAGEARDLVGLVLVIHRPTLLFLVYSLGKKTTRNPRQTENKTKQRVLGDHS